MALLQKVDWIWVDGRLVPWNDAREHVLAHTLHYGLGAFEGIRCYRRADGRAAIFRLEEHIDRLFANCHICSIDFPFSRSDLVQLESSYLRPLVYLGYTARWGSARASHPSARSSPPTNGAPT